MKKLTSPVSSLQGLNVPNASDVSSSILSPEMLKEKAQFGSQGSMGIVVNSKLSHGGLKKNENFRDLPLIQQQSTSNYQDALFESSRMQDQPLDLRPIVRNQVQLPSGYSKKRIQNFQRNMNFTGHPGRNHFQSTAQSQKSQVRFNDSMHLGRGSSAIQDETTVSSNGLTTRSPGRSYKKNKGAANMPLLNLSSMDTSPKVTYRQLESKTFREAFQTFREDNVDINENISQLAELVKTRTKEKYNKIKNQRIMMSQMSQMNDYSSEMRSSKDGNKDLEIRYPKRDALMDFSLQLDRPDLAKFSNNQCHDSRFNYFDISKISASSANIKTKSFNFEHQGRKSSEIFKATTNCPYVMTEDDKKALSQKVRYRHSYKNDFPTDHKKHLYRKLPSKSIDFNNQLLRDWTILKKNGMIVTSDGKHQDISLLDEDDPIRIAAEAKKDQGDEVRKITNPELDTEAAFKKTGAYVRAYIDLKLDKQIPRDKQSKSSHFPAFMQYSSKRYQIDQPNLKMFEMNDAFTNPRFEVTKTEFNKVTQSQVSKQRYKQMLKNRQNQLRQYFPNEYAQIDKNKQYGSLSRDPKQQIDPLADTKTKNFHQQKAEEFKKGERLEDMDFFTLLQATGFVRKEHSKDFQPTSVAELLARTKDRDENGKKLPHIPELEGEQKPWKIARTKKLNADMEIASSDSDEF